MRQLSVGWVEPGETHRSACFRSPRRSKIRRVTNYRRNFVPGGSLFFTVNLADRHSRLLTEEIGLLRRALRYARARRNASVSEGLRFLVAMYVLL
jgi:ADP-ribose pyrophosphatase YjhB (NUDIX family)